MSTELTKNLRKITLYNTQNTAASKVIETDATTYAELKPLLHDMGLETDVKKRKYVIGENKLTLEADGANLPTENFTLFMFPVKTKAGSKVVTEDILSLSHGEAGNEIKSLIKAHPDLKEGVFKGYSRMSKDKRHAVLLKHYGLKASSSSSKKTTKKTAKKTEISDKYAQGMMLAIANCPYPDVKKDLHFKLSAHASFVKDGNLNKVISAFSDKAAQIKSEMKGINFA